MSHGKGRHKWALDFMEGKSHRGRSSLPPPPGFTTESPQEDESTDSGNPQLITKLGWSLALGPWKQLPLNLLVLWMAGSSISLFPIMMVGMMGMRPVQAIFAYKPVFQKLSGEQAVLQKLTWLLANLVGLGLALYKFHAMGLLPTSPSDWLEFMEARRNLELAGGGLALM